MAKKNGGFLLGTIFGAAVAGITALLYAPKSGKELRNDLNQQANMAKDSAKDYMDIAKEKGNELKETAQKAGSEYMQNMNETMNQMKNDLSSTTDEAKGDLDSIKSEVKETAVDMKDTYKEGMEKDKEIAKDTAEDVKSTAEDTKEEVSTDDSMNSVNEENKFSAASLKNAVEQRTMDSAYDQEEELDPSSIPTEQTTSNTDLNNK